MTDLEINCKCAECLGMVRMVGFKVGAYWDESARRTRLIPTSPAAEDRKKLGFTRENSDFTFDVFEHRTDLERVEKKLAIPQESIQERVTRVMDQLCKTNGQLKELFRNRLITED